MSNLLIKINLLNKKIRCCSKATHSPQARSRAGVFLFCRSQALTYILLYIFDCQHKESVKISSLNTSKIKVVCEGGVTIFEKKNNRKWCVQTHNSNNFSNPNVS